MSNNIIELKEVKKYYTMGEETVKAVDGISVKIERAETDGHQVKR